MFRLLFLITFISLELFACKGEYDSCIKKINDSHTIHNNSLYIPIKNNRLLVHTDKRPQSKIFKHNPFLSLYIIENNSSFKYPFDVNIKLDSKTAICNKKIAKKGVFKTRQIGLDKLATYSKELQYPSVLLSACCNIEGIVTHDGIIEKDYIYNFLTSYDDYSDLGIRVEDKDGYVVVYAIDPFLKNNPFRKGDSVLEYDGVRVEKSTSFMKKVLFSKVDRKHILKIKRDSKVLSITMRTYKRYGGGDVSDTFLEQLGIYFDDKLRVIKTPKGKNSHGVLVDDRLLQVNGKEVKNQKEVLENIDNYKYAAKLLFARNGFHFFVDFN